MRCLSQNAAQLRWGLGARKQVYGALIICSVGVMKGYLVEALKGYLVKLTLEVWGGGGGGREGRESGGDCHCK